MHDIILNKINSIERCLKRIKEEYIGFEDKFEKNYTKQDSIILNLERASQATIDIATHIIKTESLGLPKNSRETFEILEQNKIISTPISNKMKNMVGFRNIAVHDYQNLNLKILISIIENDLKDFKGFINDIFENYIN
jgi:uncharacterized protein YutE (UPF0331/DUF86 family)